MNKKKIVIFGDLFEEYINKLKNDYDVLWIKDNIQPPFEKFVEYAKDADAIITLLSFNIDRKLIEKLPELKVIGNYAVGFNNIDIKYATEKKIIVLNTPDVLTEATAEIAVALTFAVARRLREAILEIESSTAKPWAPKYLLGKDLHNKIVGVIGAGRIGSSYAIKMKNLGNTVYYHSRLKKEHLENQGIHFMEFNELISKADIISVHTPLTPETVNLFSKKEFEIMKDDVIFINTSRGNVVDEKALIEFLAKGKFFGVGLDVFLNEPEPDPELLKFKNVVILPHIGSATIETRKAMTDLILTSVIKALKGDYNSLNNIVNREVLKNL